MFDLFRSAGQACILTIALMSVSGSPDSARAQSIAVNSGTVSYDFHPTSTTTGSGATWYAWHGYREGRDQIFARRIDAHGGLGNLHTVSQGGTTHGPPTIVGKSDDAISVVWTMKKDGRWQVHLRHFVDGNWTSPVALSEPTSDAIYPTAISLADGRVIAAWSAHVSGRWRVRGRLLESQGRSPIFDLSEKTVDAFRPVLVHHGDQVWGFWDQYQGRQYSVRGRTVSPVLSPVEQVSPAGEYCLTPVALSHRNKLHVAWLRKIDVIGGPGVVSQWHSLHATTRGDAGWQLIKSSDGGTTAAELTQGLMAKIDPRPVATGGYLGPRVRPSFLADGDRVWLLWERKTDHRGSTPTVPGDFVGRPSLDGQWQTPVIVSQGRVDYHLIDPPVVRDGKVRVVEFDTTRRLTSRWQTANASSRTSGQGGCQWRYQSKAKPHHAGQSLPMEGRTNSSGAICIATTD